MKILSPEAPLRPLFPTRGPKPPHNSPTQRSQLRAEASTVEVLPGHVPQIESQVSFPLCPSVAGSSDEHLALLPGIITVNI